jgi:hypothetical protein
LLTASFPQLTEETELSEASALSRQPSDIAIPEQNDNSDSDIDSDGEDDGDNDDESDIENNGVYNSESNDESEKDLPLGHVTGIRRHPCEQCIRSLVYEQGDGICYNIAGSKRCKLCHEMEKCEST